MVTYRDLSARAKEYERRANRDKEEIELMEAKNPKLKRGGGISHFPFYSETNEAHIYSITRESYKENSQQAREYREAAERLKKSKLKRVV